MKTKKIFLIRRDGATKQFIVNVCPIIESKKKNKKVLVADTFNVIRTKQHIDTIVEN